MWRKYRLPIRNELLVKSLPRTPANSTSMQAHKVTNLADGASRCLIVVNQLSRIFPSRYEIISARRCTSTTHNLFLASPELQILPLDIQMDASLPMVGDRNISARLFDQDGFSPYFSPLLVSSYHLSPALSYECWKRSERYLLTALLLRLNKLGYATHLAWVNYTYQPSVRDHLKQPTRSAMQRQFREAHNTFCPAAYLLDQLQVIPSGFLIPSASWVLHITHGERYYVDQATVPRANSHRSRLTAGLVTSHISSPYNDPLCI